MTEHSALELRTSESSQLTGKTNQKKKKNYNKKKTENDNQTIHLKKILPPPHKLPQKKKTI